MIGLIPPELGNLSQLQTLWLSENQLTWCTPAGLRDVPWNDFDQLGLPYCDVLLSALSVSPRSLTPPFDPYNTIYTALEGPSLVTLAAANEHNAAIQILDENDNAIADADTTLAGHQIDLGSGISAIRVTLTSEDGAASHSYTIFTLPVSVCVSRDAVTDAANNLGLVADCEVLLAARDTLAGSGSLNWSEDTPITEWDGVRVEGTPQRVAVLFLWNKGLTGSIPPEVGSLAALEELILFDNHLSGPIPIEIGSLAALEELVLFDNQLSGPIPIEIGSLSNLQRLSLSRNQLSGPIPIEMGSLSNLQELSLSRNQLSGPIPIEIGGLSNLQRLSLWGNHLSGPIPTEMGTLSNLQRLYLDRNQLSGPIPAEIGTLSNLQVLSLWGNQLTGALPQSLTGLTALRSFYFYNNLGLCAPVDNTFQTWLHSLATVQGSSCAPVDSPEDRAVLVELHSATDGANWANRANWLSDLPIGEWHGVTSDANGRVTGLYLFNNQLTGAIPSELGNLANLETLELRWNQLTGEIPSELGSLSNLQRLELHGNQLTGQIPPQLDSLDLSLIFLSGNQLTGCIPAGLRDVPSNDFDQLGLPFCSAALDRDALVALYNATDGANWTNNTNWLSDVPVGERYGVVTDDNGRVTELELSRNQLAGAIPAELGNLTQLQTLRLSQNKLTGCIPAGLREVSQNDLGELGLPYCDLLESTCVVGGAVVDATNVGLVLDCEALLLARDTLAGTSPLNWTADTPITEWDGIRSLEGTPKRVTRLYLHNRGLGGTIPAALGSLSRLTHLYLHRNSLTGEIPSELGSLTSLEWLSLYGNDLSGDIPAELGKLSNLKRLYLNHNGLTGEIPGELGGMASLTHLFLHRNQLIGAIPAAEWDGLDNLEWLSVYANDLSGGIPTELTGLASLKRLYLHENRNLGGTIPDSLGQLSTLTHLLLLRTGVSGPIPDSLGELSNLQWLSLYDNHLTGEIPTTLGGLTKLKRLYLHYNQLNGEIPDDLGNLGALTNLWLNDNDLSGEIPKDLDRLTNLVRWRLRNNDFTGCLPAGLATVENNDFPSLGLNVCADE